ncbi:MAG: 4Fe-4S dicluster domain-containing protein [Candidatus Bathyarchaeia archaeon]
MDNKNEIAHYGMARDNKMAYRDSIDLMKKIIDISGQNVFSCNLCGKCTAGCPISDAMDIKPHQVVRLVQVRPEALLDSKAIWLCACCLTCVSRCPKMIDIAKIMEAYRTIVLSSKREDFIEYSPELSSLLPIQALVAVRSKYSMVHLPFYSPTVRLRKYFTRERLLMLMGGKKT